MRYPFPVRLLLALAVSLVLAALLVMLLYVTELGFEVWTHLKDAPLWFTAGYTLLVAVIAGTGSWLVWRLLSARARQPVPAPPAPDVPRTREEMEARIGRAALAGVDVETAREELEELNRRQGTGEVFVALFGQVSTGKSSLVRALLPNAQADVDVRAGTTRNITRYTWTSPAHDQVVITDLPGLDEPDGTRDQLAREEAQRAHVVVYVVDGDLTREQHQELQALLELDKPLILALNKADRYGDKELVQITTRLRARAPERNKVDVVTVSAADSREVIRVGPDGREEWIRRDTPPRVDELVSALQRRIDGDLSTLEDLRDSSVLGLATHKLGAAVDDYRKTRSAQLVREYSRKAVVGAMAAVAPGTDILIQGYLGVQLVQKLCELYEVPARKVEINRLLELISRRVLKTLPLMLAMVGNGLKAFPGIGTLSGGIVHAIAYGIIFDSLGKAVSDTLATQGTLGSAPALRSFEEAVSEDLEARARSLAKLAIAQLGRTGKQDENHG